MVDDPVERENARRKVLIAYLTKVEAVLKKRPERDPLTAAPWEISISEMTEIPVREVQIITSGLESDGLLKLWVCRAKDGCSYSLTAEGFEMARTYRYEDSPLAKKRENTKRLKKGGQWLTRQIWLGLVPIASAIISGLGIITYFKDSVIAWIKSTLCTE